MNRPGNLKEYVRNLLGLSDGVIPYSGGHLEGRDCWCGPRVEQRCPECEAGEPEGCWRCGGEGWVAEYDLEEPAVIVHTYEKLRP
jgi:hypothetical protein